MGLIYAKHRGIPSLLGSAALLLSSCGTVVGNPKKPGGGSSGSTVTTDDQADMGDVEKNLVAMQLDDVIAALADGVTAASGDGSALALVGLGLLGSDGGHQHCTVAPSPAETTLGSETLGTWTVAAGTPVVTLTRSYANAGGNLSYQDLGGGNPSQSTETWFPGPYFGLANVQPATAAAGSGPANLGSDGKPLGVPYAKASGPVVAGSSGELGSVGWRSSDGSWTGVPAVEVGGGVRRNAGGLRLVNPPAALGCDQGANTVLPGWRFSQNVAGLTRQVHTGVRYQRRFAKSLATNTLDGTTTTVWADPALHLPDAGAYYDQAAGTIDLTRVLTIGSKDTPNQASSQLQKTGKEPRPVLKTTVYTTAPLIDRVVRNLKKGASWVSRTISSGSVLTTRAVGDQGATATVESTYKDVQFSHTADTKKDCVPEAGTIVNVITPADPAQQVTTITVRFGRTAGVGSRANVTVAIDCSGGGAGASNCSAAAEAEDDDYQPTGCDF